MGSRGSSARASLYVFMLTLLFVGCQDVAQLTTPDIRPPTSQVLDQAQFPDIPVPQDFVLEPDPIRDISYTGSYVYEDLPYREGSLLYLGKASPASTFEFYRQQMILPVHGWKIVDQSLQEDSGELTFSKDISRSHIRIFQKGEDTYVMIEVKSTHEG